MYSVQVPVRIRLQWRQLSVARGSSLAVATRLSYWSAVLHNLHTGTGSCVEIDGKMLSEIHTPQSIATNHIRCLYFLLLQCLLQVRGPHFIFMTSPFDTVGDNIMFLGCPVCLVRYCYHDIS